MTLPTFLVIGAMKAGTTSLHAYLSTHPDVFMSEPKELHFFSRDENWARGRPWYEEQFSGAEAAVARGESSPSYSQADIYPGAAARIADTLPGVRLVYIVRDPIRRMRSMYLHQLASGRETQPIAAAFRSNEYYLNASRYAWQLDQHLVRVPRERIKVVTTERLRDDARATLADVLAFVGVDPGLAPSVDVRRGRTEDKRVSAPLKRRLAGLPGYRTVKRIAPEPLRRAVGRVASRPVSPGMAELSAGLEAELVERLRPDVERLRPFLGADFDGWGMLR